MKYYLTSLLAFAFFIYSNSNSVQAAPGDTTWVTIFENLDINDYGDFNMQANLPAASESFQKIRMHYTLGRRACQGEQYCGSWDYTTSVFAKVSTDTLIELMRVITPYATDWALDRKHTYIAEVTDYSSILHDDVDFVYNYDGYSWGFTLTLKLEFIEGEAPRKSLSVENIYQGRFTYGQSLNSIEAELDEKTLNYAAPAVDARIKNVITGHGSDATGCGEFCSKWYRQKINGNQIAQKQLWKADCGHNALSAQTGTWIFDRANWCPGEQVIPIYHELGEYTNADGNFTADMDMQPYNSAGGDLGNYIISSQLISYAEPTYTLDAAIVDIIAPSDNENYVRFNPVCANPIIKVRNEGTTPLTSLKIAYNLNGGTVAYYDWTGNIKFMDEEVIELQASLPGFHSGVSNTFKAELIEMNGQTSDETAWNNKYETTFKLVNSYPNTFRVRLKTNGSKYGAYSETDWKIIDENGDVVASRINNEIETQYIDTVTLTDGCYTFIVTDKGCDGVSWWYYPYYPGGGPGNGLVGFTKLEDMSYHNRFNGDFGCELRERFTIGYTLNLEDQGMKDKLEFNLYPNPAQNKINLSFDNYSSLIDYNIVNTSGQVIYTREKKNLENGELMVDISFLTDGQYYIICNDYKNNFQPMTKKFIVKN